MSDARLIDARLYLPKSKSFQAWEKQHFLGAVPDASPYGLHHLSKAGLSLSQRTIPEPTTLRVLTSRRNTATAGPTDTTTATLTWDERSATIAGTYRKKGLAFSGVIWATDAQVGISRSLGHKTIVESIREQSGLWVLSRAQIPALTRITNNRIPIEWVTFGIDTEFFSPAPQVEERPYIFSAGTDRHRDPRTLLSALSEVYQRTGVESLVQVNGKHSETDGITFLPRLPHTTYRQYVQNAAAVVIALKPNMHVSGMTVALESMACGTPVVVSATPGMSDYVQHNETGVVVPIGNPQALSSAIMSLLKDPERSASLRSNARKKVQRDHKSVDMAGRIAEFVRRTMGT